MRVTPQLIYDAECGFCERSAHWLNVHTPQRSFEIVSSQSFSEADLLAKGLDRHDVDTYLWWVDGVSKYRGHFAIAQALQDGSWSMHLLGKLIAARAIQPFAAIAYATVAKYRRRLPGGTATCRTDPSRTDTNPRHRPGNGTEKR